jgi:predicted O-methyltransferase YrrM
VRIIDIRESSLKYVEWFHNKFRNPYADVQWAQIKRDQAALIETIDTFDFRTFLEIGTWKGYTALCVWLHPKIARVKCIDIHKDLGVEYEDKYHTLMPAEKYGEYFKNTFVHLQFADTMKYSKGCEQHDVIFIDGEHDYDHVKNDTELALSMNPKAVVWHDYGSKPDVTKYIQELEKSGLEIDLFAGSFCAVTFIF